MNSAVGQGVCRFTHAIVRRPARSVVHGLRAGGGPDPTYAGVVAEHDAYANALRDCGLEVTVLPALEDFPDSLFVEDPALVFPAGAIILRPGAASRAGETAEIAPHLAQRFDTVLEIEPPGLADGGDVMVTRRAVLIGLSGRTDADGARALQSCLQRLGYESRIVATPDGVLHFKTACALLDEETVLVTGRMLASGIFSDFEQLQVPSGEEAAANALRINDTVLIGAEFPRTAELLDAKGYRVRRLATANVQRIDAGLSCMSLRWRTAS